MADLEGSYYGMESQALSCGRRFKLVGAAFGGSCLVLLCIAATFKFPHSDSPINLLNLVSPTNAAMGHQQRLRLQHKPWVSSVIAARDNADVAHRLKMYGVGQFQQVKLPMSVSRANHHDWGDGSTYAINPRSRLGKLALEAKGREDQARMASAADIKNDMSQMDYETDAEISDVDRGVLSQARNMAGVMFLTNFFDRFGFATDAST